MKKKTTRKIRRIKRKTQRRKNRSYKRMRGGVWPFNNISEKQKIRRLLTNVIINNYKPESKKELCSLSSLEEKQNYIDKGFIAVYENLITSFTYKFYSISNITRKLIEALKQQKITFFDKHLKNQSEVDLLSHDEFKRSLSSKLDDVNDELVYSMLVLAERMCVISFASNRVTFNEEQINLDDLICSPTTANI
jgi:hypothetical protein